MVLDLFVIKYRFILASLIKFMKSFKVKIEHYETPGQFDWVTVSNCKDSDECIDYIEKTYPEHDIYVVRPI